MNVRQQAFRVGLTLMELVVVLSILALMAALAIPKLTDLTERSRSATQAYSTADVARMVEIFFGMNRKYPDGWDTLTAADGTLYSKLNTNLTTASAGATLTTGTLTADQITSLSSAGIGHVFVHDTTSSPSSSGTERRHLGTGTGHDGTANISSVAVVNETAGSNGLSLLVNDFGLNPNRSANDTTLTRISANTYVVLGLGPKCTLVQTQVHEAPLMENERSATTYSRALAVFEVPDTGTAKAKLVGIFGPDGRSKNMSISDYTNINGVQPH